MKGTDAQGASALVTGASRGIGLAIARRLAENGFHLTISARESDSLVPIGRQLAEIGVTVQRCPARMDDEDQISKLSDEHAHRFGRLDVLVLAAGVGMNGPLETFPLRRLDKQYEVNLRGPFQLVQRCMPLLRVAAESRPSIGAKIIAIASITGIVSEERLAAYGATKSGLISLCESINVEHSGEGISATALAPGYVDTAMAEWVHERIAVESMMTTSDVAEMAIAVTRLSATAVVPRIVMTRAGSEPWRA